MMAAMLSLLLASGQSSVQVSGVVTAREGGDPLPGVVVTNGTVYAETDLDGAWSLQVPDKTVLSFILGGMRTVTLTVSGPGRAALFARG